MITTEFQSELKHLSKSLENQGFWVQDSVFTSTTFTALRSYYDFNVKKVRPAKVGRKSSKALIQDIRSDSILWVDENDPLLQGYFNMIRDVTKVLKEELFLPLKRSETQMALYQKGQHYDRHKDRHKNTDHRWITSVFYLNSNWKPVDGGELIIHYVDPNNASLPQSIEPQANRVVIFLSELEHEVAVTQKNRKSFTTWFRDDICSF